MTTQQSWLHSLALLPGGFLALLPAAKCPFCIAAYTGVLSSVGLGVLHDDRVLSPLVGAFLVVGGIGVAWSTASHRRLGPLLVTVAGSGAIVAGRLVWSMPVALYGGLTLLVGASFWNLWLKRPQSEPLVHLRLGRKEGTAS